MNEDEEFVIDFTQWLEDPINSDKTYSDYINEIVFEDEISLYDKMISQAEMDYLDAKRQNYHKLANCFSYLLLVLRRSRGNLSQKQKGEI